MKKLYGLLVMMVILILLSAVNISASADRVTQNPPIIINTISPTVDGNIDTEEGWSRAAVLDDSTAGYFYSDKAANIWADVYFACDDKGFYFAADICDGIVMTDSSQTQDLSNQFVQSTSLDTVDNKYGWNGDVFCLMLDPLGYVLEHGWRQYTPWYLVSMYTDGEMKVIKKLNQDTIGQEITAQVDIAGTKTMYGWCFELFMSWNRVMSDSGNIFINFPDDVIYNGALIRAGAMYIDRYINETGKIKTYNVYSTVPEVRADGTPGINGSGDDVGSLGITLIMSDVCALNGHSWNTWYKVNESGYADSGKEVSSCDICGVNKYREYMGYIDRFKDVKEVAWYAEAVGYCVARGYMNGMSSTKFSPSTVLTREQFVVMLANYAGAETDIYADISCGMSDVATGRWYSNAISWAVDKGYIKGISPGVFGTGRAIKRAELTRLLYLYTDSIGILPEGRADLSAYVDGDKVEDWMYESLQWAVYNKIITSTKNDVLTLSPREVVTRAQAAMMLMKYDKKY